MHFLALFFSFLLSFFITILPKAALIKKNNLSLLSLFPDTAKVRHLQAQQEQVQQGGQGAAPGQGGEHQETHQQARHQREVGAQLRQVRSPSVPTALACGVRAPLTWTGFNGISVHCHLWLHVSCKDLNEETSPHRIGKGNWSFRRQQQLFFITVEAQI